MFSIISPVLYIFRLFLFGRFGKRQPSSLFTFIKNDLSRCEFFMKSRGEYNVENLKLIRQHHKNCKTHPKGKKISKELAQKTRLFFNPFFNDCHSSTHVQVIGNKSADLGLFFSQIRFGGVRS
jgi:hypothetical protein